MSYFFWFKASGIQGCGKEQQFSSSINTVTISDLSASPRLCYSLVWISFSVHFLRFYQWC